MSNKVSVLALVLALIILIDYFFILRPFSLPEKSLNDGLGQIDNNSQAFILPISESSQIPILNTTVRRPLIEARAMAVFDTDSSKFLYSKNIDQRLAVASLTKIMTAVITLENFDPKDIVTVPKSAVRVDKERQTLYENEKITVENLFKMMLVESSNDAAYALAYYAEVLGFDFIKAMNKKAFILKMNNTDFIDPAGLDDAALSTIEDLLKLVQYSLKYDQLWSLLREKEITIYSYDGEIEHKVKNTNQLLEYLPELIGGKTGFTDGALGCLILVLEAPNKRDKIISIILGSNNRFGDSLEIVNWVKEAYIWQ